MAQPNQIAVTLSAAELQSVQEAIGMLKTTLLPKLKTLSAQDRQELPKMGDKTVGFVQKCFDYGKLHPEFVPPYLNLQEFEVDLNAFIALKNIERELTPLGDLLNDSLVLSGSEAFQAALVFYSSAKNAAKLKMNAAQGVCDDLANRFPGTGRKNK